MTCKVYSHRHTYMYFFSVYVYISLFGITIKTQRLFQYEHLKWSNITVCGKS